MDKIKIDESMIVENGPDFCLKCKKEVEYEELKTNRFGWIVEYKCTKCEKIYLITKALLEDQIGKKTYDENSRKSGIDLIDLVVVKPTAEELRNLIDGLDKK